MNSDGTWITWRSHNILWLPREFRPSATAVQGWNISIGCTLGRVLIFNFDLERLLPSLNKLGWGLHYITSLFMLLNLVMSLQKFGMACDVIIAWYIATKNITMGFHELITPESLI